MSFNFQKAECLGRKYETPIEDVIFIALNRYGISNQIEGNRLRFKLKLNSTNEFFYFAVCTNNQESPFLLKKNNLILKSMLIGRVFDIEKDTCDSTYFRRNCTTLTLNSNMRSQCVGCKFCGTYQQDPEDLYSLTTEKSLSNYIKNMLFNNRQNDLRNVLRVTVCTGCFGSEDNLVEHLIMIRTVLKKFDFDKKIRYIGSELNTSSSLKSIAKYVSPFSLSFTLECFTKRKAMLKDLKGHLSLECIQETLITAKNLGFATNFLYILGIDPISELEHNILQLLPAINRFPIIQIYQNFNIQKEIPLDNYANELDYFLVARRTFERIFKKTNLRPRSWENYRSLWYMKFGSENHKCIRI